MSTSERIFGWLWLVIPVALLAHQVWVDVHTDFLSFGYYFAVWGGLLAISLCGAWFLIGMPGAKWVLRTAAVAVALYVALMGLVASSNAPFYSGHDFVFYGYVALVVAFCVATYFIAGHRAA
jgi:hypothetical protein